MTRIADAVAAVSGEIDAYMKRPCSPPPADGLTPLQRMKADPTLKRRADAEWNAMDARGNLPDGWQA